ncbi:MAG: DUF1415 domain-containing protein [Bacteroidota bacterium]
MQENPVIIAQTKSWINNVVVGCNFCPFAAREVKKNSISYEVMDDESPQAVLERLVLTFLKMDDDEAIETSLLILPAGFASFNDYLELVSVAEKLLKKQGYDGIYQIASFHPEYLFAGSKENDAANYTNRSPYPMLHILREESVSRAIDSHPDTKKIPANNIAFARAKGESHMRNLLKLSLKTALE